MARVCGAVQVIVDVGPSAKWGLLPTALDMQVQDASAQRCRYWNWQLSLRTVNFVALNFTP